jgi:hypothetical protein
VEFHLPVDVAALAADFYVTSAYKWSGPHISACVADPARWAGMWPDKLVPSPDTVPERFEYGTPSFASLAGMTAAVEHLAALAPNGGTRRERVTASMTAVRDYESALFTRLIDGLAAVPGVWLCPADGPRCPTVAFRLDGQSPAETATALGTEKICVFAGDYYAVEIIEREEKVTFVPFLIMQGALDDNVLPAAQENFVKIYKAAGGDCEYHLFENSVHEWVAEPGPRSSGSLSVTAISPGAGRGRRRFSL